MTFDKQPGISPVNSNTNPTKPTQPLVSYSDAPKPQPLPQKMTPEKNPNSNFWKSYAVISTAILIMIIFALGYQISEGKFISEVSVNNELNNSYEFKPNTSNNFNYTTNNEFQNDFIISLDLDDSLLDKICENYTG